MYCLHFSLIICAEHTNLKNHASILLISSLSTNLVLNHLAVPGLFPDTTNLGCDFIKIIITRVILLNECAAGEAQQLECKKVLL